METKASQEKPDLSKELQGDLVDGNAAAVYKIERFFPFEHHFADTNFADMQRVHLPLLSRNQHDEPIDLSKILVFDLETTGLAGGAGTFPFLIGLGTIEPDGMRTVQYFLPDYGREPIAYLDLDGSFKEKTVLLSFNGKSYDYPLLNNRFILNRIENPWQGMMHLDLLHFARRLWKSRLTSCSLEAIEQEIFLFHRYGDIEGWLIPQAYFDFLQTGKIDDIRKIINHNQQDLISLGRLLFYLDQIERADRRDSLSDHDLQSLFRLAIKSGEMASVQSLLGEIESRRIVINTGTLIEYSLLLKRKNLWHDAAIVWEQLLAAQNHILFALEELAKYHEHKLRNLDQARYYTVRGLKYLEITGQINRTEHLSEAEEQFQYRLDRLMIKIARQ